MRKLILLAFLFISTAALSQIPKPLKNTYVNDFAHVLSRQQIKSLNKSIFRIEKKSSVQFAVVLVNTLPKDYEIEDFALLIGRKWHVGKAKNGIVYVAAINQHKQRLEVAKLLLDKFTDEKSAAILTSIKPYFKKQDYNGGLQSLVNSVSETIDPTIQTPATTPLQQTNTVAKTQTTKPAEENAFDFWIGFGAIVLFIYIIYRIIKGANRRRMNRQFQNFNTNGGYPYGGGYNGGPSNGGGSGVGSFLGGAALGAAGGYLARAYQDRDRHHDSGNVSNSNYSDDTSNENDDRNYGNWGSDISNDSSGSDSSDNNSNDGFSGDGATSDW